MAENACLAMMDIFLLLLDIFI